jgi:mono/diheme cytochrome c family protein
MGEVRMKAFLFLPFLTLAAGAAVPPDHAEKMARGLELFRAEVAPLLKEQCVKCHGGEKIKSDFDMATREGLLRGGMDGVAVVPFRAGESRLMKLVRHEDDPHMPEKKPKLPEAAIAKIAAWIDLGAPYDTPLVAGKTPPRDRSVVTEEDRKWWSFQPLASVQPPAGAAHPVDAFLLGAAKAKGLGFNPPADPRALIRRAALDLTGLPPTPEEVEAFVAAPEQNFAGVVDRLLESPAYGERWARHWLDVARFAESSGFEHDYDRPHAFHYRDFVIQALNADMPFDQFARWQLAGDEFAPGNPQAMMATGFLGAGVFPTQITANEVERTRYDALDDMLSTTSSAFLGLTVGCARCHDHKFDPIPSQDYYRLLSTFTTTVRSNVDLDLDPAASAKARAAFEGETARLNGELASFEKGELRKKFDAWLATNPTLPAAAWNLLDVERMASKAGATFRKLEDDSWLAEGTNGASDVYTITAKSAARAITGLKLEALTHATAPHQGPGRAANGNFALSRIRITAQPLGGGPARDVKLTSPQVTHQQNKDSLSAASSLDDNPKSGWAVDGGGIGKDQAVAFSFAEPVDFEGGARFVITLEFDVNTGHNLVRPRFATCSGAAPDLKATALPAAIAALAPKLPSLSAAERDVLFAWWKTRDPGWRERNTRLAEHAKKPPIKGTPVMVCAEGYTPIVMHSQGAPFFNETHILKRGDPTQKQSVAAQSFLQVLMRGADEKHWAWSPPKGAPYSGRRRALANWMTDVDGGAGALMARVAVNRLWQHHFGRGLVASPSDFGKTGVPPSNPALLDWLAGELIRGGWRLKPIHRLIMTSAAYRQSSAAAPAKVAADPDNALFLRHVSQRLESEAVRDGILAVSGALDRTMFGPGTLDENSKRRSIYFTVKRSRLMNSMVVFDAPEPLTSQGARPTTTVAPQALLLMNSPQARQWASAFARRVRDETKSGDTAKLVARAYLFALARPPREAETQEAAAFLTAGTAAYQQAGKPNAAELALTDFCQTLLALNEFVYAP